MVIYVIVCSATLKIYVGQHKHEDGLQKYMQTKFSDAAHQRRGYSHLFNAMRKHPKESWSIHPLVSGITDKKELDETEQLLIYALGAQHPDVGYNICDGGEGHAAPHTEDTRRKMSETRKARGISPSRECIAASHTPESDQARRDRARGNQYALGQVQSPEQIAKRVATWAARVESGQSKYNPASPEKMAKMREAALIVTTGKKRPPSVMAACQTPEARAKRVAALKGMKRSPEFGEKIALTKFLNTVAWG
jgi:hypothetical protein